MKKYLLIILIFNITFIFSQNKKVKMSEANKKLLERFENQEQERKDRISSYLAANPNFARSLENEDNSHLHLYDIIQGKPVFKSTYNADAARSTKTHHLQPGGSLGLNLAGSNMTIGVWDGGPVDDVHPEFQNASNSVSRVQNIDNAVIDGDSGNFSSHGTHVAGTISAKGVDSEAMGMATDVKIKSYNWTNDEAEIIGAINGLNPIILSNHSYGIPIQQNNGNTLDSWLIGAYTIDARDIDEIHRNNPQYLLVASAGNNGTFSYQDALFSGFDKLTSDKNAKNSLVIANANPTLIPFSDEIQTLVINSSSSQGPTDDIRIKPDIAGDGTNLYSPVPNDSYATFSGTSMSAPNVTGSLALIQEYYNSLHGNYMLGSTLKALVCHTAIDDAVVGPDPVFGWGLLNSKAAAELILEDNNSQAIIDELTLDEGNTYTTSFSAQAGDKLVATISWTDMPGNPVPNGTLNDTSPRLVNDLDIRLTKDGVTYFPWRLDYDPSTGFSNSKADNIRDNVEKIEIDAPSSGSYTLTVSHKGSLLDDEGGPFDPGSQDFSLIVSGNNITLSTTEIKLSNITIYPNPTSNIINVEGLTSDFNIIIFDIQGRTVAKNILTPQNNQINLQSISPGTYLVKIFDNTSSITKKIIKK
jgi:subtilisin family serine protease